MVTVSISANVPGNVYEMHFKVHAELRLSLRGYQFSVSFCHFDLALDSVGFV